MMVAGLGVEPSLPRRRGMNPLCIRCTIPAIDVRYRWWSVRDSNPTEILRAKEATTHAVPHPKNCHPHLRNMQANLRGPPKRGQPRKREVLLPQVFSGASSKREEGQQHLCVVWPVLLPCREQKVRLEKRPLVLLSHPQGCCSTDRRDQGDPTRPLRNR